MTFCLMVLALEILRECPRGVETKKRTDPSGGQRAELHGSSLAFLRRALAERRSESTPWRAMRSTLGRVGRESGVTT